VVCGCLILLDAVPKHVPESQRILCFRITTFSAGSQVIDSGLCNRQAASQDTYPENQGNQFFHSRPHPNNYFPIKIAKRTTRARRCATNLAGRFSSHHLNARGRELHEM
jgi:hypothetical protein